VGLSDVSIRKAKPKEKDYKLADVFGLYLLVKVNGTKCWRYNYRFEGKQKTLSLGTYPDVSLKDAREQLTAARGLLQKGVDPSAYKKATRQTRLQQVTNRFELLAREWHIKQQAKWTESHAQRIMARLETHIFPYLGNVPITDISPPDVLKVLQRIESQGKGETTQRCMQYCSQVFRYAVASGLLESDPTRDLRGALQPFKVTHRAAITNPVEVGELMRAIRGYSGEHVTRCALQLLPLVFTRPAELRHAEWSEIDFDAALWSIPADKMKMRRDHVVPLSRQALAILADIQPLTAHRSRYVFPSIRSVTRPMSENTLNAALQRLGYLPTQVTPHGFRVMARTNLDEVLGFRFEVIEMQLAHEVRDATGRAYNRTQYLDDRRQMMQVWADWLDTLCGKGL